MQPQEYIGFWLRVVASLIDSVLLFIVTAPLLIAYYGDTYWNSDAFIQGPVDLLISWIFPAIAIVLFWIKKQATPGKLMLSAQIVDARTSNKPTTSQYIYRYVGYFVATIPLGLGFIWVAFDKRKQGWHDKLAGTIVIRPQTNSSGSVSF
ncbi:RDD family protein [Rheinheimera oceanensis]|uniref:RDD family protein n=1 Tax=Rheinheimera oceanensis TaxID=2817449 RepID=UPI001BFDC966|nr:RDD family protein [Rheinheimera oceanensis]